MEDEGEKMTKKRGCEVSREGISRNWANLPVDILWLITTQLCYYGRIRFRGVCKSWRESCHISSSDRLPFLMSFDRSNLMKSCEFMNMSVHGQVCDNTSRIDNPTYAEDNRNMYHVVLSSKKGWLLLVENDEDKRYQLVMYNPFKKETIKLPTVDIAANPLFRAFQAEMSESPEEPGFMVFIINAHTSGGNNPHIRFATWQRGHTTWKKYSFKLRQWYSTYCLDVVYNRNRKMFYCLLERGLGIFNPMADEFSFLEPSFLEPGTENSTIFQPAKLIETEEEPLLFFQFDVFKLDRSSSRLLWMKQNNLGNRIVFISQPKFSPQTTAIAVPAEGELRNLANRVYFSSRNSTWFNSPGTNMCFPGKEPAETSSKRVWIEPPLLPLEYPME